MQATLLFGVGAAKAGTTWLYRYLAEHPECAMPEPKELHYFDTLENGGRNQRVGQAIDSINRLDTMIGRAPPDLAIALKKRREGLLDYAALMLKDEEDPARYLRYMTRLGRSARLVGDLTPAYGLLPEARLRQMSDLAPRTRFVLLLRDPVDRLWSNLRDMASRRSETVQEARQMARDLLLRVLDGGRSGALERSDYAGTLQRLDRAVPGDSLFVEFYERLFTATTLSRLCRFLGISMRNGRYGARVHSGLPIALNDDARAGLARVLAPQYAYVSARFGDLPDRWTANMEKV